jgi:hypothetical protein
MFSTICYHGVQLFLVTSEKTGQQVLVLKAEDDRRREAYRRWTLNELARRYKREQIYEQICSEPAQHVAKRYNVSNVAAR